MPGLYDQLNAEVQAALQGGGAFAIPNVVPAGVSGLMTGADKTKLDGVTAGADNTAAALVAAGTTIAHVSTVAEKLDLLPTSMGTITTGTTQPISFTDALFTGLVTGGAAVGTGGTLGVVAASFGSGAAETGTGAGQGGLGSTAAANQPYNTTDFPGGRYRAALTKTTNGQPLVLLDILSTAAINFPLSVAAPVFLYIDRRTDLGANLKWRGHFYFENQATGLDTPVTPNVSVANVALSIPQVFTAINVPTSAGYNGVASPGAAEIEMGATADMQTALGAVNAGSSSKVMPIDATIPLPTVAQLETLVGPSTAPLAIAYPAAIGASNKFADQNHQHEYRRLNSGIWVQCDFDSPASVNAGTFVDRGGLWTLTPTGAGSAINLGTANTASLMGSLKLSRGTDAAGSAVISMWQGGSTGMFFPFATADAFMFEWVGASITAVSSGTNTYKVVLGFGNFFTGAPNAGIWFEWDANTNVNIKAKTATGGVVTTVATTAVVAGTGFHRLTVTKAAGTNTLHFLIDGVDIGVTGTLMTGVNIAPVAYILSSANTGVDRILEVDYFELDYQFAANRYT